MCCYVSSSEICQKPLKYHTKLLFSISQSAKSLVWGGKKNVEILWFSLCSCSHNCRLLPTIAQKTYSSLFYIFSLLWYCRMDWTERDERGPDPRAQTLCWPWAWAETQPWLAQADVINPCLDCHEAVAQLGNYIHSQPKQGHTFWMCAPSNSERNVNAEWAF